jgi:hypothetical protein
VRFERCEAVERLDVADVLSFDLVGRQLLYPQTLSFFPFVALPDLESLAKAKVYILVFHEERT